MKKPKKTSKTPTYESGGGIHWSDVGDFFQNAGVGTLDMAASTLGADKAVDNLYAKNNKLNWQKDIYNTMGGINKSLAPMAATAAFGPMGGVGAQAIQGLGSNFNPKNQPQQGYYANGGDILPDFSTIEVEGDELEVTPQGKLVKDFKKHAKHSSETGGPQYPAKTGNIIIPAKMRDKYLNGGKIDKQSIIQRLQKEQAERESSDKEMFDLFSDVQYGEGGKIHIKPENRGKFTAAASKAGMGVQAYARHVLANKDRYSSTLIKRANFARNATHFKHEEGGAVKKYFDGSTIGDWNPSELPDNVNPNKLFNTPGNFMMDDNQLQSMPVTSPNPNLGTSPTKSLVPNSTNNPSTTSNSPDYKKWGYLASMAASPAYHLGMGLLNDPDHLNHEDYQNPYSSQSRNIMAGRSINMKPIRDDIRMERTSALSNARNAGTSSGQYLSNANQLGLNTQRALAGARMQEQQANNAYRGEEANNLNQLGSDYARTKLAIKDINDRNKAAKYKNIEAGLHEVGTLGQGIYGDDMRLDNINNFLQYYDYDPKTRKFTYKTK